MKYFFAFFGVALGALLVIKAEWFYQNFGSISWAEEHLASSGGSRLMYKLIGLGFIIIAIFGVTGLLGEILLSIFGGLFGQR